MFHVKLNLRKPIFKGTTVLLIAFLMLQSCAGAKQSIQVPDYVLVPNGRENIGENNLTAFIFENNMKNLPIEQFLSQKYKTNNYYEKEVWVTIDGQKYKIIVYDYNEFEKYFISTNYSPINVEPENSKSGDQRKFIAISMISAYNEDCLADGSLLQNTAVKYLKNLKDEYINSNGNYGIYR